MANRQWLNNVCHDRRNEVVAVRKLHQKQWPISLTLICIILGLIIALQLRAQENLNNTSLYKKNDVIVKMIKNSEEENQSLQAGIQTVRDQINEYEKEATKGESHLKILKNQLDELKDVAGLTELEGSGVIVIMDDNKTSFKQLGGDPRWYIIHNTDLLRIINELWAYGAEAIAVNDQRIVMMSEVRCVGNTIMINAERLAPPFKIKAIGDPEKLRQGIEGNGQGILYELKSLDFPIEVKESQVIIPAYKKSFTFNNVEIVEEP